MRFKQFAIGVVACLPLLAAGCSDPNADVKKALSDLSILKKAPIQISVPKTWSVVPDTDLAKLGPQVTFAASDNSVDGQGVRNVNLVEERLVNPLTSLQYSYANMSLASQNLTDYIKLAEKDVMIKDPNNVDIKTKLHEFQARFDTKNPKRTFLQIYATQGYKGYTVTLQTNLDEKNFTELEKIVSSFRFVN